MGDKLIWRRYWSSSELKTKESQSLGNEILNRVSSSDELKSKELFILLVKARFWKYGKKRERKDKYKDTKKFSNFKKKFEKKSQTFCLGR